MNQELRHKNEKPAKPPTEEDKLVQKFTSRFKRAEQRVQPLHKKWQIVDMFDRAEQWKEADLPPWVPKPVHNMIRFIRVLKRANLASAIPAAHYAPLDKKDKDLVNMIQFAYKHVWDTEKVDRIVRKAVDRALLQGTQVAMVYSDDNFIDGKYYGENDPRNQMFQGAIKVKRVPVLNFFPDPDATSIDECSFVEITEKTTLAAIKNNKKFVDYAGERKLATLRSTSGSQSDVESGQTLKRDHNPFESSPDSEFDQRVVLHAHWDVVYDEDGKKKINLYYYLPGNDFILYKLENIKPNVLPFAVYYDEEEENDFWGSATAWDILEKQRLINKTEQAASNIATLYQNPQKIVARESGINGQQMAREGTLPGKVWVSSIEPSRSVFTLQPPDIPRGLFDIKDRNVADIKDSVGINEAYSGESIGSLTTSTGVNSLIDRATIRDKDKMKQIDDFVEALSNLIVLFVIEKWKEKRPLINYGPAGKVTHSEWEPIDKTEAENLRWVVRSDVYATAPTTAALKKQQADNLLQMQGQFNLDPPLITIEEWLSMQDFDNKQEILERMEDDRKKKEKREAQDFAALATQLAQQAQEMLAMGTNPQQVTEMLTQQAKQMLDGNAKKETQLGFGGAIMDGGSSRPKDAKQTTQPQGDTGMSAMMAQARGM